MNNMLSYITWRGDLSFDAAPFCEVDALILAQISYIDFSSVLSDTPQTGGVLLAEVTRRLLSLPAEKSPFGVLRDKNHALLVSMSASKRFSAIRLSGYTTRFDPTQAVQFCALCVELGDGQMCISFRGTDNTLVGWKEDLNMSFLTPVPGQELAADFVGRVAGAVSLPLRIIGHSKGGNLAVYAAAFCDSAVQTRISQVYSFDAPGMPMERLQMPGYLAVRDRLLRYIPQTSIIGMLLAHDSAFTVIDSSASGVNQHELYSWQVLGPAFVKEAAPDATSRYVQRTIDLWLSSLPAEDRERFVNALFVLLDASGAKTIVELQSHLRTSASSMAVAFARLDAPSRDVLLSAAKLLAESALHTLPTPFGDEGATQKITPPQKQ